MKIAIIGFGLEGRAAYDYYKDGNEITICDQNEACEVPEGLQSRLGNGYLNGLDEFDVVVRSPFVHPRQIADANSPEILEKVTSNTNEFLRVCTTRNIIGITGTKGKGTTSSLIAAMLEACGKRVHLGGNIGLPALELLKQDIQPDDWVVLELSSFQLIDCRYSPHIAVCLMFVPEHLNWHADMAEYQEAKSQLFRWQTPDDIAVYYSANALSKAIAGRGQAQLIPYYQEPGAIVSEGVICIQGQEICRTDELQLIGEHNWQNICAAATAVWQVCPDAAAIGQACRTFHGLEHRLQLVRAVDGVQYYDDSFGTTPETAIVALQAFSQPKVIILGGSDKGASYDELARTVARSNVRQAILIGDQAERIRTALDAAGFHDYLLGCTSMTQIVDAAQNAAQDGDVVLLSTGCASFDMFKDYKDRGNQFISLVQALA